ncbi:MAG: signal recognition particle-docking protein FtsY [Chlamydiae bacterium]|nr:signal recognition particle-docking protein FtsY [Chlamydiota bacterium]
MFDFFKSKLKKVVSAFGKFKFALGAKLKSLFSKKIDEASYQELEKTFYEADLGAKCSMELVEKIKELLRKNPEMSSNELLLEIKKELLSVIVEPQELALKKPHVIMIVGVNGSGKTTSIVKLANFYKKQNKKVLLVAADTFRAAAVEQLDAWAKRLDIDIVKSQIKADPSSVVFDALSSAKVKGYDVVLIDTAGRLHTKTDLMQELEKIKRVANKVVEDSPNETILILDATIGQNALDQAKIFNSFTPVSSILLSKLDGTAKGGIVIAVQKELKIPIKWVGIGETVEDLAPFEKEEFINALLDL